MIDFHLFDWIDKFPVWLQFVVAIPIGFLLVGIIASLIYTFPWWMKKSAEWGKKLALWITGDR